MLCVCVFCVKTIPLWTAPFSARVSVGDGCRPLVTVHRSDHKHKYAGICQLIKVNKVKHGLVMLIKCSETTLIACLRYIIHHISNQHRRFSHQVKHEAWDEGDTHSCMSLGVSGIFLSHYVVSLLKKLGTGSKDSTTSHYFKETEHTAGTGQISGARPTSRAGFHRASHW